MHPSQPPRLKNKRPQPRRLPGKWCALFCRAAAAVFLAVLQIAAAAAEPRFTFHNSTRQLSAKVAAGMRPLEARHLAEKMEFSVALQMRNFPELQQRVARGEIIPHDELERTYLPLENDYAAIVKWLADEGFTITQTDPNRLCVFASGTIAQIQKSLAVQLAQVTVDGVDYRAAHTEPSLPARLAPAALGINGLQPFHRPHKQAILRKSSLTSPNVPAFIVSEILKAYGADNLAVNSQALTGAGQKIAILIDTVPNDSDLTTFWTNNNIPQSLANIEKINVNNLSLPAPSGEETLDAEWASGIAPGAKVRIYAAGSLSFSNLDKALQRLISDLPSQPGLHQLSISLGLGETYVSSSQLTTDSQYFATIASNGVSVFVSSGDDGSTPDSSGGSTGSLQPEYFSSDPSVTAVGGTSLTLNTSTGQVATETAWSGSGGGTSTFFSRPSWQAGAGVPAGSNRLVPDVSLVADPNTGAYVYLNGAAYQYGGTSLGTPIWAGFCALINDGRAKLFKPPMGLLNTSLYPLNGTNNFRDITSGSNAIGANSGGSYSAAAGYDEVTGLGAPVMSVLAQTLVSQSVPAPVITGFSPSSGVQNNAVTITGTNLTPVASLTFNGASASFVENSSGQVTAYVPAGATTGPISITTGGGTANSAANFTINPGPPAPTVTSFTPATGGLNASVTITGTFFTGATAVFFNGTGASFTVNSSTQITAIVPIGATTGPVSVTTPSGTGTSASSFAVIGSGSVVISQVYGGGGGAGATYRNDFIELFNRGNTAINLGAWSVQYISATGGGIWSKTNLSGTILPGQYFLIRGSSSGANGQNLPTPDISGSTNLNATNGRVALISNQTTLSTGSCPVGLAGTVDFVGYGSATCYEGTGAAPAISTSTAAIRANGGCTDTDVNAADFFAGTPTPRNSASPTNSCAPDLTVAKNHTGNFKQGDSADSYTITVTNSGVGTVAGNVSVTDTLPAGLTATAIGGTGWTSTLGTLTCTRTDTLAPAASYPPINVTVSVANNAAASVTNTATVSGGGETNTGNDTASDPTTIFTPVQSWRQQYFNTTSNSDNAADTANPAGDGIPNLLKYALGLNPLLAESNPVTSDTSTGYLRLTAPKNPAATDVTYSVEVTGDLLTPTSWTTSGTTIDQNTSTLLQVHDNTPIGSVPERFIHLRVTVP
jgi:kumamolisin